MMTHFALFLICTPLSGALRYVSDFRTGSMPQTKAGCGAMYVGAGSDAYVLKEMKIAQRTSRLQMTKGYCATDKEATSIPVIYFHDRPNINAAMIKEALGGEEPLFEMFFLGTSEQPVMEKWDKMPTGDETKPWHWFKWLRPQLFQLSTFDTTLSLDGDAVPCSGAKLSEAFKFHYDSGKDVTAPAHDGALNMGFVIFETEKARPWASAWAYQMRLCIQKNGGIEADQQAMKSALGRNHTGVTVSNFNDHNICRRAVKTTGCSTLSCWVDHRPGSVPISQKMSPDNGVTLDKDEEISSDGINRGEC